MVNQHIAGATFKQPAEVVEWMVAMQSQVYPMAKWAIGLRLPGAKDADIEEAFNRGEILRTHVLRPTWHFVHPSDIRWLLKLTGPRIQAFNKMYYKRKELDASTFKKSHQLLEKALQGGKHLTRTKLQAVLGKGKIKADGIRLAFLMMQAELDGIICSGKRDGKQFTYALLEERVPIAKSYSKDESLVMLAERYFRSRGPATANDFAWWSGLTVTECREGISALKDKLISDKWNGKLFYLVDTGLAKLKPVQRSFLMPDYDEYGIAYKDRSALFDDKIITQKEFYKNRYPHAIVVDGIIAGTWKIKKRSEGRNKFSALELKMFSKLSASKNDILQKASHRFQNFAYHME